jgi:uncharacterized protein involved in outer membrane biogenesis
MPEPAGNPPPTPRRKWLRRLAIGASGLVLLLVIAYLVVTSGAFFKGVILPRAGRTLNADITVADASIHPFSGVTLQGLTVKPAGGRPVLQADRIQVRYDLWSILRGRVRVDEVTIVAPVIDIVQNADGTSNLDPFLKGQPVRPGAAKPGVVPPGQPPQLDVKAISIKNATVRLTRDSKEGGRQTAEISRANLSLDQLANGRSGKLVLDAESRVD